VTRVAQFLDFLDLSSTANTSPQPFLPSSMVEYSTVTILDDDFPLYIPKKVVNSERIESPEFDISLGTSALAILQAIA
jgi:hypothetical protein